MLNVKVQFISVEWR